MTGIFGKASLRADKSHNAQRHNDSNRPVETAGSLAMWQQSLLMGDLADSFSTDNPFAVDYAAYGISADAGADFTAGFLGAFANAVAVIGECTGSGFSGGSFAGGGGFSGGGGGFSSTC
jgi:uncharacterized membrane protein YgcG